MTGQDEYSLNIEIIDKKLKTKPKCHLKLLNINLLTKH